MSNKLNLEKIFTSLAFIAFTLSISTFPTLLLTKYLRNNKTLFAPKNNSASQMTDIENNSTSQMTDLEHWLMLISVTILFVILPIILIKITEYKDDSIYVLSTFTFVLCIAAIFSLIYKKGEINNCIIGLIYLFFCIFIWILLKTIRAIYSWLWTRKIESKGKKTIIKKELDVKKIALIWAVLSTIISLLFGFKK